MDEMLEKYFIIVTVCKAFLSDTKSKEILNELRIQGNSIMKELKIRSPMMQLMMNSIKCSKCNHQNLSFHVFCPYCTETVKKLDGVQDMDLTRCRNTKCPGSSSYSFKKLEEVKNAVCRHSYRLPKGGMHVPVLPVESAIATIVAAGLIDDCAFLTEEQIREELKQAIYWGYYSSFFSLNAGKCYKELGLEDLANAIYQYNVDDKRTGIEILNKILPQMKKDQEYFVNGHKGIV